METAREILRGNYREFAYVVVDNSTTTTATEAIEATHEEGISSYSVYFADETNPKIVFPDDLEGSAEWADIKDDSSKLQQQVERCIDKDIDGS